MGEEAVEIADAERAEDQDAAADAGLAQLDAFLDVGHREPRRAGLAQRPRHRHGAVPVGVGLDDGDDAGARAGAVPGRVVERGVVGQVRREGAVVGPDGRQIDPGRRAANHMPGARGMNLVCPAMKAVLHRAGRAVALLGR